MTFGKIIRHDNGVDAVYFFDDPFCGEIKIPIEKFVKQPPPDKLFFTWEGK
jgi:hypothetical protein